MIDPISATIAVSKDLLAETLKETTELKVNESLLSRSLETIEGISLEALEAQNLENFDNFRIPSELDNPLRVEYYKHTIIKEGEVVDKLSPDFNKHTAAVTSLPKKLHIASDKTQFVEATKLLKKQYEQNPEKIINNLKEQNKKLLERDNTILEKNWKEIKKAETKMLEATEAKDYDSQAKYLKELRSLTRDVVNIETPKGKPLKILNQHELLDRQIKDITSPSSSSQGRIYGFQWHHHQDPGKLQLVVKDIHEANLHEGGNSDWGRGVR